MDVPRLDLCSAAAAVQDWTTILVCLSSVIFRVPTDFECGFRRTRHLLVS